MLVWLKQLPFLEGGRAPSKTWGLGLLKGFETL